MRVIVTRPAAQAAEWVAALRAEGLDAVALPLMAIEDTGNAQAVTEAWSTLADRRLVMFVSPNAAERFFAARPQGSSWPAATLAGSPGPGTSAALRAHGVPPAAIVEPRADAPRFDSESLWAELAPRAWAGERVLIVRGVGGRDWLADTLRAHGAHVEHLSAYRRSAPSPDAAERLLLDAAVRQPRGHLWFFSSSESIDHLAALAPGVDWSAGRAIATHPRIAARARVLGLGDVVESRPPLGAVVACIQSIGP